MRRRLRQTRERRRRLGRLRLNPLRPACLATPGPGGGEATAGGEAKSANPYQHAIDEQKSQAAEMSRRNGEKRADGEFMADVRRMATELKGMIRRATEQARAGEDDSLSSHEARELDDAAVDLDRAMQQAGTDLGGGLVSLIV